MAKKKAAKKAGNGARKKAIQRDRSAMQATLEVNAAEDQALREGADLQRLLTQAVSQVLEALRQDHDADRQQLVRIETTLAGLDHRISDMTQRFRETAVQATGPEAESTASNAPVRLRSDTRHFLVHGWRQSLWISETNQSTPLPKPRKTIVGRALSDLGATSRECDEVTILQVFRRIQEQAPHHLDQNALWNLESAGSTEKTERDRATSGLNKVFKKRFERLRKALLADHEDGRRWLTGLGRDIFQGWPDWQVEHDDEECEGDARLTRRRLTADANETATTGAENGSVGGQSD